MLFNIVLFRLVSSLAYTGVVLATTEIFNELSSTDEKCSK